MKYELVATNYPYDLKGDNALYRLGWLYQYRLNQPEKAMGYYKILLLEHQNSIFSNKARAKFRKLREAYAPEETIEITIKNGEIEP